MTGKWITISLLEGDKNGKLFKVIGEVGGYVSMLPGSSVFSEMFDIP